MPTNNRLFLLDAYALIYRAYYAFIKNPRINSKGDNTSAVFGFVNTLEDLLKRENPTHIAVCFDPHGPTFRHEAYELYKAQREETPEVIRWSVPIIKEIVNAYNIPTLEVAGFEADDVIGTLSKKAEKKGYEVFMMTPDKDYGQLVSEHVRMYRPRHGINEFEVLGPEEVNIKYGLSNPLQMIDLLGLMGDSSDNIPGCPGIGEVTAKKLLAQFGDINTLLSNTEQLKGSLKEKVTQHVDQIKFSKFLATIRTDVPIEMEEKELERETPDMRKLQEIFESLEFRTMIDRVGKNSPALKVETISPEKKEQKKLVSTDNQFSLWDEFGTPTPETQRAAQTKKTEEKNKSDQDQKTGSENPKITGKEPEENFHANLSSLKTVPHSYHFLDNEADFESFLSNIAVQKFFSLDTETTGLDVMTAELVGMSFCWKNGEAYYLPFPEDQLLTKEKMFRLKQILENPSIRIIGQNIKFDLVILKKYGINLDAELFDTMIAHYLLQPELKHNMDYLAEVYLNYRTVHIDELIGAKGKNQLTMRDIPQKDICPYAAEDADITLQLQQILEPELTEKGLDYLSHEVEMPLIHVLAEMEYTGVGLDTESLQEASVEMTTTLDKLEKEIQDLAGISFNVNSPKQTGEILFETLNIVDKAKKTKTGQYSTSEEVLESLKGKHPIVEKILEQRGLKKLL
ncbi:MAG: DNA polymerase, partial [Bacteroidota bacterium]|nr:DNA polymerase [Bacteroidota bacterium]